MKIFLSLFSVCLVVFSCATFSFADNWEKQLIAELQKEGGVVQPIGQVNAKYNMYFTGTSYIANLSSDASLPVPLVTFPHGTHTFWHIHHGTCQVLVPCSGRGYYQIWGEEAKELLPGQTVTIPANTKHWHGAAPKSSFQHIALMRQGEGVHTEWLEPVDEAAFKALR